MKQIIFSTIFIFTFCFAVFAQANKNQCPQIEIEYPASVNQGDLVNFVASINEEQIKQPSIEWEVIVDGKTIDRNSEISLKTDKTSKLLIDTKQISTLQVRAKFSDNSCRTEAFAEVKIKKLQIIACYFPTRYKYQKDFSEDIAARLDTHIISALNDENLSVVIALGINQDTDKTTVKTHIKDLLKYTSEKRGLDNNRIRFMLFWTNKEIAEILALPVDEKDFPSSTFNQEKQLNEEETKEFLPNNLIK